MKNVRRSKELYQPRSAQVRRVNLAQRAFGEQCLHVSSGIEYAVDGDGRAFDAVEDSVRFARDLEELRDANILQFRGDAAPAGVAAFA